MPKNNGVIGFIEAYQDRSQQGKKTGTRERPHDDACKYDVEDVIEHCNSEERTRVDSKKLSFQPIHRIEERMRLILMGQEKFHKIRRAHSHQKLHIIPEKINPLAPWK